MSWSINFIGKSSNIVTALKQHSEKLTGNSKKEFDSYLNDMVNLVSTNFNKDFEPTLHLKANGHSWQNGNSFSINLGYADGDIV